MTRSGRAGAGVALVVSVGLHAGGLIALAPAPPPTLAGGPPQLAMIGNGFEDAVADRVTGTTDPVRTDPVVPVTAEVAPTPSRETLQAVAAAASAAAVVLPTPQPAETAVTAPTRSSTPTATPPSTPAVQAIVPIIPAAPTLSTQATAAAPTETVLARDAPVTQTPTVDTPRPQPRADRPAPQPPTSTPPRQTSPAPQGEAAETRRAGDTGGAPQGNAPRTQAGAGGQAASDGRAAAEYPQHVNRHLARLNRPDARFDGAAIIAFTIAPDGGLAAVSVAQSSGQPEFDRLAIAHVQRGAPFPAPPEGAQRSYNVTVRGR
ncbi:TonB family protein [Roseicyclus mahoneyensis]|uniref:Outer membrane transport energization protein TonB n=1 Tax=Roseicyclus mahoneyensis TaxID=164332 RepID=A0A316GC40_9RHOB|nr:TonB family protein [Roseicyclus mahoneyensis]PWK58163.1 outer membrane transport energization protein TonB [Roseicyclus mahoneyensis]